MLTGIYYLTIGVLVVIIKLTNKGGYDMSQMHSSTASIEAMLDRGGYSSEDIKQALADLDAMKNSISEYTYKNLKALLQAKL